jgi:cephalosporin-C deacetylase-like acetyl esterase
MQKQAPEFKYYPSEAQLDAWLEDIWETGSAAQCDISKIEKQEHGPGIEINHRHGFCYLRLSPEEMQPFYAYWQPALSYPAPLLVHTPGYGAEMSMHPELAAQGFNVLHINPLGYATPDSFDDSRRDGQGNWPVMHDTIISGAQKGYRDWLLNCVMAISWAWQQPEVLPGRISFYGTSQGGGMACILASMHRDRGLRCVAADVAFLTNFPLAKDTPGAYAMVNDGLKNLSEPEKGWHALGFIDTLSHARRLTVPVLLTAGGSDQTCPPATIESLFHALPGTRSYTYLDGVGHCHTEQFIPLAAAWFRLYA